MNRKSFKPHDEGISTGYHVYGDLAAGPALKRIQRGASLNDLQQDYALFTYAPLFLYGGLEHNPIQEWINLNNHPQVVYILRLNNPFIHIGGPSIWDNTLWLVEKEFWADLSLHIGSMAFINRSKQQLTRVVCQELTVPDVCASPTDISLSSPPTVRIATFSVDSNLGCLAFKKPSFLTGGRPQLKLHPPREESVKLATALFQNDDRPYSSIQPLPWEEGSDLS